MRILVIAEDAKLERMYTALLADGRYLTDAARRETAVDDAASGIYDAMLVDLSAEEGALLIRRLRDAGVGLPVLAVTGDASVSAKINVLDSGADAVLARPFEGPELLAQLRALVRRRDGIVSEQLVYGNTSLDIKTCMLQCKQERVRLSAREFEMMRLLMANRENLVPKETLLLRVWGYESNAVDNYVEVYISYLRRRLKKIDSDVSIRSVRRLGYHLTIIQ